jgi:hypothetical protein
MREMPRIIDYPTVAKILTEEGYRCNYPSSGSFSLRDRTPIIRGWLFGPDETIVPELLADSRVLENPTEGKLAEMAIKAWQEILPGNIWLTPASHWSFELSFGHPEQLKPLLLELNLDADYLATQTNGAAIEFEPVESDMLGHAIKRLLEFCVASDFMLIFPRRLTTCMIHHHKQLWWVTSDPKIAAGLK